MGLLNMKMTPEIEAYQEDYSGWTPENPRQAQDYYSVIDYLRRLPQNQQPSTDSEIFNFMKAYTGAAGDYSGYLPQPQNVNRYLNAPMQGSTDDEIYQGLLKNVGPALPWDKFRGR